MGLGVAAIVCIAAFVVCAFALRFQMQRLLRLYEAQIKALSIAEIVLLHERRRPDLQSLEGQITAATQNARLLRKNAALFRALWPDDYDGAFYAGERLIAQCSRLLALSSR